MTLPSLAICFALAGLAITAPACGAGSAPLDVILARGSVICAV
jgi:hypothetical protein